MKIMVHWPSCPLAHWPSGKKYESFAPADKLTGQRLAQHNNVKPRPVTSSSSDAGGVSPFADPRPLTGAAQYEDWNP